MLIGKSQYYTDDSPIGIWRTLYQEWVEAFKEYNYLKKRIAPDLRVYFDTQRANLRHTPK